MTSTLTERQQKWFESIKASFVSETGKSLDEWVEIAKGCPETKPNARKKWFKDTHGLGTNRASVVLGAAFPSTASWQEPDGLRDTLWKDEDSLAILKAIEAVTATLDGTVSGQRKAFTAFSKEFQYAAARPVKGGHLMLGLAVEAAEGSEPRGNESWSERCRVKLLLKSPADVDAKVAALLKQAWERS